MSSVLAILLDSRWSLKASLKPFNDPSPLASQDSFTVGFAIASFVTVTVVRVAVFTFTVVPFRFRRLVRFIRRLVRIPVAPRSPHKVGVEVAVRN